MEGRQEATGGKQHGAHGEATALLIDPFEVAFGDVSQANSPGRAVEELVAIPRENTGSPSELWQGILLLQGGRGSQGPGLRPNLIPLSKVVRQRT